eukprot:m.148348 g.148348  ORF g.148348 m.148348 type:complete len:269 (+) comp17310_c0_seq8:246-1052(+)
MAKKKSGKKGKKGKKSGKKKSAKAKEPEVTLPPPLEWPWQTAVLGWMGRDPRRKQELKARFRRHYIEGEGIVCSAEEWKTQTALFVQPYENPEVEAMVRMIATCIAQEGTRKQCADNFHMLAAGLRCRHSQVHFERMLQEIERFLEDVSSKPKSTDITRLWTTANGRHIRRQQMQEYLERRKIIHGRALTVITEEHPATNHANPFEIFQDYVTEHALRLVDLFRSTDKDGRPCWNNIKKHQVGIFCVQRQMPFIAVMGWDAFFFPCLF